MYTGGCETLSHGNLRSRDDVFAHHNLHIQLVVYTKTMVRIAAPLAYNRVLQKGYTVLNIRTVRINAAIRIRLQKIIRWKKRIKRQHPPLRWWPPACYAQRDIWTQMSIILLQIAYL